MPNPSEEQRKLEERIEELKTIASDIRFSKNVRNEALTEASRLKGELS